MFWYYIFPFFIFQGRETTTWLTSGCSQRRQTHWGMELGFDGFGVSAAEHSPLFSTLIHKYYPSLLYSLSSNQVFFSLKQWMKPRAMQGSHQLNLFPLYCLFEKPVWSVYFLFCITVRLTRHPVYCKSSALSCSMKYSLIWFFLPQSGSVSSVVISTDTASYFYYSTTSFSVSYFVLHHTENK